MKSVIMLQTNYKLVHWPLWCHEHDLLTHIDKVHEEVNILHFCFWLCSYKERYLQMSIYVYQVYTKLAWRVILVPTHSLHHDLIVNHLFLRESSVIFFLSTYNYDIDPIGRKYRSYKLYNIKSHTKSSCRIHRKKWIAYLRYTLHIVLFYLRDWKNETDSVTVWQCEFNR